MNILEMTKKPLSPFLKSVLSWATLSGPSEIFLPTWQENPVNFS